MSQRYRVAVLGATGLVGRTMIEVLAEQQFPVEELIPLASERSAGQKITFQDKEYATQVPSAEVFGKVDIALFSAGGSVSKEWAPIAAREGAVVIDNSSAFRMEPNVPLVVPEVNAETIFSTDGKPASIIANPNCSTIQMVVVLKPLHDKYTIKRVVVSTYQSVTGKGKKGLEALEEEIAGKAQEKFEHVHPIAYNVVPHIDVFLGNDYTKEEMKMVNETQKILNQPDLKVSPTTVRVPVYGGHAESVNIEFEHDFEVDDVRKLLAQSPGILVNDHPGENVYPMPIECYGKDDVFVGRIRRDYWHPKTINMWIVADNLRKGAATNAVQIANCLIGKLTPKALV